MKDLTEYRSVAQTIQTDEITSDEDNARIIDSLRRNDPGFTSLSVFWPEEGDAFYYPESGQDLVWLGYFIGSNTKLQSLCIKDEDNIIPEAGITRGQIKLFLEGVNKNRSIKVLDLDLNLAIRVHDFEPLFRNTKLVELTLYGCRLDHQAVRVLPFAQTLERVEIACIRIDMNDELSETLQALGLLPKLHTLALPDLHIGMNGCREVAAFLEHTPTMLTSLDLNMIDIDDAEAIELLVPAISTHSNLKSLNLSNNRISTNGQRSLLALLSCPNSNLEQLNLHTTGIDPILFADALANNKRLTELILELYDVSSAVWEAFSQLLCDTSSANKTFVSNHTLCSFGHQARYSNKEVGLLLDVNEHSESAMQAAVIKTLWSHPHLNVESLFEWDFKVLPLLVQWFRLASDHVDSFNDTIRELEGKASHPYDLSNLASLAMQCCQCEENMHRMELSVLYQFVRGMPLQCIESCLLAELKQIRSTKMRLQQELEESEFREQQVIGRLKSRRIHLE